MIKRFLPYIIGVVVLLGLSLSIVQVKKRAVFYPPDLTTYIAGYNSVINGLNPYSEIDTQQSIANLGITATSYKYVYSPSFLLLFHCLKVIPYQLFRLFWLYGSVFAVWLSVLMLFLKSDIERRKSWVFLIGSFIFLLIADPLLSNSVWGNISAFLFLALTLVVIKSYQGKIAALASLFILITKVGFLPFLLFLRDKKTYQQLLISLTILIVVTISVYGLEHYSGWYCAIKEIGNTWNHDLDNNFSITNSISILVSDYIYKIDENHAREDDRYRLYSAVKSARIVRNIYWGITSVVTVFIAFFLRKFYKINRKLYRDQLLSITILYILIFTPFVWVHYGLFLLIPLWVICNGTSLTQVILFVISSILWGTISSDSFGGIIPVQFRFVILFIWMIYFVIKTLNTDSQRERNLAVAKSDR